MNFHRSMHVFDQKKISKTGALCQVFPFLFPSFFLAQNIPKIRTHMRSFICIRFFFQSNATKPCRWVSKGPIRYVTRTNLKYMGSISTAPPKKSMRSEISAQIFVLFVLIVLTSSRIFATFLENYRTITCFHR